MKTIHLLAGRNQNRTPLLITALILLSLFFSGCGPEVKDRPTEPSIDKSATMRQQREEFIQKMVKEGIFAKVEKPGSVPHVWVRPAFYALDYDTKKSFLSVVYAYHFDNASSGNVIRLKDSRSGKDVGTFSAAGLDMEKD